VSTDSTALVVVDAQAGFADEAFWGRRDNPGAEANIRALVAAWRERGWPLVLVRHDSSLAGSPLEPGQPGNELIQGVDGPSDLLVTKSVNSSFHGSPDLAAWLRSEGLRRIAVCGITTNHCCETTARVGGNLGFDVTFVLDATHTFDRVGPDGVLVAAEDLARATAASLHGEFATVSSTAEVLAALPGAGATR
jgi:nicotinamidase-related amidase